MNPNIRFVLWTFGTTILMWPGLFTTALIISGMSVKKVEIWKNKWININYKSWKFWALYFVFMLMFMFGLWLTKNGLE